MTPHNSAFKGDFAPYVLFPGDPARSLHVARNFMENARQVTGIRGMTGYTGTWKGVPVSVMSGGMGGPSAGIYAYELYTEYGVEAIIRIGTSGGLQKNVEPGDIVFALTASTDSAWARQYRLEGNYSPSVTYSLLERAVGIARKHGFPFHAGMVFSSDLFSSYNALGEDSWKTWARMGALVQDMETYALYSTAAWTGRKALSILTMTDSCVTGASLSDGERMIGLEPMIRTALDCVSDSAGTMVDA
ncbi:purine-nucleoside phosphorylase [Parasphaerochaeta coccoides]|uniref:Uridine phosphorylase n=1 Tax=Parasphaerochaeta coccoides (strain ATCC BAA-1237 / DSM 17374 / SPN1) TaxID=760011 RepID=F4GKD3_PARC1|nr:purine-nucleoside phosphorylase [Parasphaerochaeta coccoides]AEC02329.1 purine-nucleoside phosphorylase [Parasphaerochaeta coccoides DSM 17374]